MAPRSAALHYNLALEFENLGRLAQATTFLRQAADLETQGAAALTEIGRLEIDAGNWDAAVSVLDEALERDAHFPKALNHRGVVAFLQEQYIDAVAFFRRAVEADSELADGWFNLADGLREIGNLQAAAEARKRYEALKQ